MQRPKLPLEIGSGMCSEFGKLIYKYTHRLIKQPWCAGWFEGIGYCFKCRDIRGSKLQNS